MSDKPLRKCPRCAKMKLQRLIGSGAGIIFKGSGFYETDYKRKDQPKPASEGKADSSASSSSSGADAAAKPSSGGGESKPSAPAKAS
jgi:predicted nucleic acid-binding Zn ribbon protein